MHRPTPTENRSYFAAFLAVFLATCAVCHIEGQKVEITSRTQALDRYIEQRQAVWQADQFSTEEAQ